LNKFNLSKVAIDLLRQRYSHKGESSEAIFKRVSKALAIRDDKFEKELYDLMTGGLFLPNSPCIRNAGKKKACLSACFVLPISDSIDGIFETLRNMALIFQRGGGTGTNFSSLRPKGASLTSGGTSSGVISFLQIFDATINTIKQGGFRKGASLATLDFDHPEITDFCRAKLTRQLTNFNLSVMVTDQFMKMATSKKNGSVELKHSGKVYNTIPAKDILDLIALGAWVSGDPGLLFFDRINKDNKYYPQQVIRATNPCGEIPSLEYGACVLGSINLSKFVEGNNFNFERFYDVAKLATRALLNINIINAYPIPQVTKVMQDLNSVGVGLMGFADCLILLGIKYDSQECLDFIDKLCEPYIKATEEVAPDSFFKRSIAPTGSLSIIADCSAGIEPIFDTSFERRLTIGTIEETRDIYKSEFCRTAHQVSPEWHLKIQGEFAKFIDAGVSKTINAPYNIGVEQIKKIFVDAWKMGVKGITVFREGSIEGAWVSTRENSCEGDTCYL